MRRMDAISYLHAVERRKKPRAEVNIPILDLDGGAPMLAHDIGMGGLCVTSLRPRWPGTHIRVRFKLPYVCRPIRATCRVVDLFEATCGTGMALKFLALAPKAELAILRYVGGVWRAARRGELPKG